MYIDSHFHALSMIEKGLDLEYLLGQNSTIKLSRALDVAIEPLDLPKRVKILKKYEFIDFSLGSGPWNSIRSIDNEIKDTLKMFDEYKDYISAIGEIGLDYFHNYSTKDRQFSLAKEQILLANHFNKPVIFHNRESDNDMIKLIEKTRPKRALMHCYSGKDKMLDFVKEAGIYCSFACNITYKNNVDHIKKAAATIDESKILLETDSPYLSPLKLRGKPNTFLNVISAYEMVSKLRNISIETLGYRVVKNYNNLFDKDINLD